MKKRNSSIYTVVIGKKIPALLLSVIMGTAALIGGLNLIGCPDISTDFLKFCISSVLGTEDLSPDIKNPRLTAYDILNPVCPVFSYKASPYLTDTAHRTASVTENKVEAIERKKINEKTISAGWSDIKNETDFPVDATALVSEQRSYNASGDKPRVLIIHTHACETYSGADGFGLGKDGSYRTTEEDKNMIHIGEIMAGVFKENGINVLHDTTLCDYPKYNDSYITALGVINWYLEKYPSIEFVFDIHRDAIEAEDGTPTKLTCTADGTAAAQAMIVCGTDAMGLENPDWRENLILALKIQKNLEEKHPGFMRPVNLRKERFNMHKTKGSLLFEVGTHGNTIDEAVEGAKILAEGIAEVIN